MYLNAESARKARDLFGKLLLTTKSDGWGKDLRFIADVLSKTATHLDECAKHPTVRADVTLVEYGYQIDISRDEHTGSCVCRDFGGAYDIDEMATHLEMKLVQLMRGFEKDFVKSQKKVG